MKKSDKYWKDNLTREQYDVLRNKATEKPFSGEYDDFWENGEYYCAACKTKLFSSENKFNAHCGWPSFDRGVKSNIELAEDNSLGMNRVEVICKNCGGHLGHVFNDGPKNLPDGRQATGERFCINSAALNFQKRKD